MITLIKKIHLLSSKCMLAGMLTKIKTKEEKVIKTFSCKKRETSTPTYVQLCQSLPRLVVMEAIVDRTMWENRTTNKAELLL